jgi:hypothetical protein
MFRDPTRPILDSEGSLPLRHDHEYTVGRQDHVELRDVMEGQRLDNDIVIRSNQVGKRIGRITIGPWDRICDKTGLVSLL